MSTSDDADVQQKLADAGFLDHDPANPPVITDEDKSFASPELRSMLDLAEREVSVWIADMNQRELYGKVVDISEVESDFKDDKMVPLLTIETPTSRLVQVFCWHTVLCNEVERQINRGQLVIGGSIAIVYKGSVPPKGKGNPTEMYRVVSRPPKP